MRSLRFLQLDVFCERPGGGNPLGVVIGADGWSSGRMQAFAAWTQLVETTYILPATDPRADYRLRIFTPSREIAFAGHPSVGTAHAALTLHLAQPRDGLLMQECASGLLPLRVAGEADMRRIAVQAPTARALRVAPDIAAELEQILTGLPLGQIAPALVEGGRRWWIAELAHEAQLRFWIPPHAQIAALAAASDSLGLALFARSTNNARGIVVRAFPCGVGIAEDPASGAANGLIAARIRACEPQGPLADGYRVSQGREIGHDATLEIEIDADGAVWVGGMTHTIIDGTLQWPEPA